MPTTASSVRLKPIRLAFTTAGCAVAALLSCGCGPSKEAGPTENSPAPTPTSASSPIASASNEYSIGDKVLFGSGGNSQLFKISGWSDPEPTHSWTDGVVSVLAFRIIPVAEALTLKIKCGAFTNGEALKSQPVEVYANDEKIASWEVRDQADYTAPIPPAMSKSGGLLTITFKIPRAVSPKSLGMSSDPRLLGLACTELTLAPTQ